MTAHWIELEGTANTRDLGGLPLAAGGMTRDGVVIRSDNLQDLTPADVERLRAEHGVTLVVDLRTVGEAEAEGPTPLQEADVDYTLLPYVPDLRAEGRLLPDREGTIPADVYLGYLSDLPDNVVESVRRVARADGATVIHCAAGKDRTGTLAALILDAVGVERAAVLADYEATGEVIEAVMARLAGTETYAADARDTPMARHVPRSETLERLLGALDDGWGGAAGWLLANGLADEDLALLRQRLTG